MHCYSDSITFYNMAIADFIYEMVNGCVMQVLVMAILM
ncbi:hypothetical protein T08_14576 [Trichinella sp. T8]|nr:hypothetical protein T08_14576 [Trichinella sp. T8]